MAKIFKRRRNFERATSFRLEYCYCTEVERETLHRDFKSFKALAQWESRNEDCTFDMLIGNKLALIDGTWEPFTTIGKKNITRSDLIVLVDYLKSSF